MQLGTGFERFVFVVFVSSIIFNIFLYSENTKNKARVRHLADLVFDYRMGYKKL
jgi:hypothetical protein